MRILLTALLLPFPAFADAVRPPRGCHSEARVETVAGAGQGGFQRLDRLPPANVYLTLYRELGHCPSPVVVRARVGNRTAPDAITGGAAPH